MCMVSTDCDLRRKVPIVKTAKLGGDRSMPRFYFNLHDGYGVRPDLDGTVLPNLDAALEYGVAVARELMRNREPRVRFWKLDVCNAAGGVVAEIGFAPVRHER